MIDELSLAMTAGEAVGVIGPNGAGKTTMLNLVIGRLRPDAGVIRFDGLDVTGTAPHARCRAGIALTHQIPHPFEAMTVFENTLVGAIYGRGRRERDVYGACVGILHTTGLGDRSNRLAGTLTLLERKRLELARALATEPRLLLLDEIAGGLTEAEIQELLPVIAAIRDGGVAILWIEHIVHALRSIVDRLVAIDFGRFIVDGPVDAVMAHPDVQKVYLGIDVE